MKIVKTIVILFFVALSTNAHKALLLVEDNEDGSIYIEAGISTGGNAAGNMIIITEAASGKPIWQGPVPDSGNFDIKRPKVPYIVTLDMGAGHKVSKRGPFPDNSSAEEKNEENLIKDIAKTNDDRSEGKIIAVDLVPVEKILKEIVKGTDIKVINLLGTNASIDEIEEYVKKQEENIANVSLSIDAFCGIRSIWPEENLFNYLRKYNIRIVEMDLATPLDPKTSGVGIKYTEDRPNRYIWLNFTNITKMMEIATSDLSQLFPQDSAILKKNLKEVKKNIFISKTKFEKLFSSADIMDVAAIGNTFDYILNEIGLFKTTELNDNISDRDEKDYNELLQFYKSSNRDILIHKWEPIDKRLKNIIKSNNVMLVILDVGMNPTDNRPIISVIEDNYNRILKAVIQ